jgi:hypothetical protein
VDPENLDAVRPKADASECKARESRGIAPAAPPSRPDRSLPPTGDAPNGFLTPKIDSLRKAYGNPASSIPDSRLCLHQVSA